MYLVLLVINDVFLRKGGGLFPTRALELVPMSPNFRIFYLYLFKRSKLSVEKRPRGGAKTEVRYCVHACMRAMCYKYTGLK